MLTGGWYPPLQPAFPDLRENDSYAILDSMKHDTIFMNTLRRAAALALALLCLFALSGCRERDPHAGMVQVHDGRSLSWVFPWKGAAVSDLDAADFYTPDAGNLVSYTGTAYTAQQGVDVSYFQGEIDWQAVADDGVEFAMIRAGYRGYTDGVINIDQNFTKNAQGALDAGLEIGLYFFSQAISEDEAVEEARWLLEAAKKFDVTLPLVFDWETIGEAAARTDGVTGSQMTACAQAFCSEIRAGGHEPGVYFNRWQGCYDYNLGKLTGAQLWLSADDVADDWYYAHSFWQYTYTGKVAGIEGDVDRNLRYLPADAAD